MRSLQQPGLAEFLQLRYTITIPLIVIEKSGTSPSPEQKGLALKERGRVGQQLGMYRLVRLLGQNGFSEVYLGKYLFDNRLVAIKVLDGYFNREDAKRFLTQVYYLTNLEHPHIVRTFDLDIDDSRAFML